LVGLAYMNHSFTLMSMVKTDDGNKADPQLI